MLRSFKAYQLQEASKYDDVYFPERNKADLPDIEDMSTENIKKMLKDLEIGVKPFKKELEKLRFEKSGYANSLMKIKNEISDKDYKVYTNFTKKTEELKAELAKRKDSEIVEHKYYDIDALKADMTKDFHLKDNGMMFTKDTPPELYQTEFGEPKLVFVYEWNSKFDVPHLKIVTHSGDLQDAANVRRLMKDKKYVTRLLKEVYPTILVYGKKF